MARSLLPFSLLYNQGGESHPKMGSTYFFFYGFLDSLILFIFDMESKIIESCRVHLEGLFKIALLVFIESSLDILNTLVFERVLHF